MQSKHYLFVGGVFGEFLSCRYLGSYFGEITQELTKRSASTSVFQPSSFRRIEDSIPHLMKTICQTRAKFPKKELILVGHSKGSLDVLMTLLSFPKLITSVDQVILFHTPFHGASIIPRTPLKYVTRVVKALQSLEPGVARKKLETLMSKLSQTEKDTLFSKIQVVKSSVDDSRRSHPLIRFAHQMMSRDGIRNDGVLSLRDQECPFGFKESYQPIFHGDLFTSQPLSFFNTQQKLELFHEIVAPASLT